jgi:hypothetical protein
MGLRLPQAAIRRMLGTQHTTWMEDDTEKVLKTRPAHHVELFAPPSRLDGVQGRHTFLSVMYEAVGLRRPIMPPGRSQSLNSRRLPTLIARNGPALAFSSITISFPTVVPSLCRGLRGGSVIHAQPVHRHLADRTPIDMLGDAHPQEGTHV